MFKKIFLFFLVFSFYSFSYSYDFNDYMIKKYADDFKYYNYYTIDNLNFLVQAPLKTKDNWNKHYESCEEATLLVAHYNSNWIYIDNISADSELDKINYFEEKVIWIVKDKYHNVNSNILYLRDISILKLHNLAKKFYHYTDENSHLVFNPSIDTIKYLISNNYILIVPSNTKTLANPNFNQDTDSYHVINLVWYDSSNFISLDSGTSKWAFYKYSYDKVINWIRDNWDVLLVLEWKINEKNVDFDWINKQIILEKKLDKILSKIDNIIKNNPKNSEKILKNILVKLNYKISNVKNNDVKDLLTSLQNSLNKKLQFIIEKKQVISYLN